MAVGARSLSTRLKALAVAGDSKRTPHGGFLKTLDLEQAMQQGEPVPAPMPYLDKPADLNTAMGKRLQELSSDPKRLVRAWGDVLKECHLKDLAPVLNFDTARYTRRRIAYTPTAEVLLMCWLPGQATLIHDHGQIQARVFLVSGQALETEFSHRGHHARVLGRTSLQAGDEFRERPGSVHRVEAVGRAPLITLHLNSPPLTVMHQYDEVEPAHR